MSHIPRLKFVRLPSSRTQTALTSAVWILCFL